MAFRLKIFQVGKFPTSWSLTKLQDFGTRSNFILAPMKTDGSISIDLREKRKTPFPLSLSLSSPLHAHSLPLFVPKWAFFPSFFLYFLFLFSSFIPPLDTWLNVSHSHKSTTCHSMFPSPKVPCGIHRIKPCVTRHPMPRKT